MKIKNIFFDWSGTLFDDFQVSHRSTNATLKQFGARQIDIRFYRDEFVLPAVRFYEKVIDNPPYDEIEKFYFNHFQHQMPKGSFFHGAIESLRKAHRMGIDLFIFSTVRQDLLEKKCRKYGIFKFFKKIYGDMADKEKKLPQTIKTLRLKKDETLFIGDMEHDVAAAKKARVKSGVFLCGYRPADHLIGQSPDFAWNDHAEFKKFLTSLEKKPKKRIFRNIIPTVGALIFREKKILLIQTHKWRHTFGIPGGKIKKGESQLHALHREIKEETGLKIFNIRPALSIDSINSNEFYENGRHFLLLNYYADTKSSRITLNDEAESFIWIDPKVALGLNLNEPTRILIQKYLNDFN